MRIRGREIRREREERGVGLFPLSSFFFNFRGTRDYTLEKSDDGIAYTEFHSDTLADPRGMGCDIPVIKLDFDFKARKGSKLDRVCAQ